MSFKHRAKKGKKNQKHEDRNEEEVKDERSVPKKVLDGSVRSVKYTLSLPERIIRSMTALIGGVLKESSDFLVPATLKESTTYRIFIGNLLRYGVENIGRVEGAYGEDGKMDDEFALKKTIGNGVEMVGIVAVSASPLWVLAFMSDAIGGVKGYFNRIAEEFERQDLLQEKVSFESKGDFLDSLQKFSDSLATNIDTPPLSREEMKENYEEMKKYFLEVGLKTRLSLGQIKDVWSDMIDTAVREKRSVAEISGAMTMYLMNKTKSTGRGLKITGKVTSDILHEDILDYYKEALAQIKSEGYLTVVKKEFSPYLKSMTRSFSPEEIMLTERIFSRDLLDFFGHLKEKRDVRKRKRLAKKAAKKREKKVASKQESFRALAKPRLSSQDDDDEEEDGKEEEKNDKD